MSSSYVVKYTMNGDSRRPLWWKTHRLHSSVGAEFIMTISIRLSLKNKRKITHANKTNNPPHK